ncbi:fructose-1,6-bisphosphatase, class II, partial [Yersinia pestis PY-52]
MTAMGQANALAVLAGGG